VQELSTEETAQALDLAEQTVKTRLHRARGLLRRVILQRTEPELPQALPFRGALRPGGESRLERIGGSS